MADRARGNASAGRGKGRTKAVKAASAARNRRPAAAKGAKAVTATKPAAKRRPVASRASSRSAASARGGTKAPGRKRPSAKRSKLGSVATAVRGTVAGAVAAVRRTVSGRRVPDAITLLEADHRRMEDLLKRGEQTTERGVVRRKELLDTIASELAAHEMIEEKLFYPALQSHPEAKDIVLEGFEEHHVADVVVKELGSLAANQEQWGAKFKVLQETIQHHIDEEEGEMFRTARAVLAQAELDALGREMAGLKARARPS